MKYRTVITGPKLSRAQAQRAEKTPHGREQTFNGRDFAERRSPKDKQPFYYTSIYRRLLQFVSVEKRRDM